MTPRPRERILTNLESLYRDAYEQAGAAGDAARQRELDASYQREQLLLEVLLDIRDGLYEIADAPDTSSALDKVKALRDLTRRL
ncbi:MAG TPA: hypothetical protein VGA37_17615 [Gemmatimonadales bacterium]|jgi:hypothetical protein